MYKREYKSYSEYVQKQAEKLDKYYERIKLINDEVYQAVKTQLKNIDVYDVYKKSVLCLGARLGGEVRAFIEAKALAIGIDLNPGVRNRYVLHGDFHQIQFPDEVFDFCFTNCLDHTIDLRKMLDEIKRVLKPEGKFIVDIANPDGGRKCRRYEAILWENADEIMNLIKKCGYLLISSERYGKTLWCIYAPIKDKK